jgi:ergothioneine biosynthesis protein EgtB
VNVSMSGSSDQTQCQHSLAKDFLETRQFTDRLVEPLTAEDCMIQSMEDASPTRWHLAHTTWFFETFILQQEDGYQAFDQRYHYLFNSYYNSLGKQFPRSQRGLISRPGLDEIKSYRQCVDQQVLKRLESPDFVRQYGSLLTTGIQHEQQHQELILTDIKHALACNPLSPAYLNHDFDASHDEETSPKTIAAGNYEIGYQGGAFSFDNEGPRHTVYIQNCQIADHLVTCGEFLEFIEDDGYQRPEFWLSEGWSVAQRQSWEAPLYWTKSNGGWSQFTLAGTVPLVHHWPVCHVSLYEADAYARWKGHRLPTEFEWEIAVMNDRDQDPSHDQSLSLDQDLSHDQDLSDEPFADYLYRNQLAFHPTRSPRGFLGGLWQWTSSSYQPYPGYHTPAGAIGEYNGKFMCNQYVLRGGSVATSSNHIRPTYRNFFPAHARWQFTGIRLAD